MFLLKYRFYLFLNVLIFYYLKYIFDYSYNVIKIVVKDIIKDCKWNIK